MRLNEFKPGRYRKTGLQLLVLVLLTYGAAKVCGVNFNNFLGSFIKALSFIGKMYPPEWSGFSQLWEPTLDTLLMALIGTILGSFISVFFALLAAANISNKWIRGLSRTIISIERSIPELFILLILVAAYGFGALPGIISLMIGCIGMLGKLLADAIEEIDKTLIESMQSVGANKLQIICWGVLPQILPNFISYTLFRLEINIRLSVLLGAVGAGGIGYEMEYSFNLLQYHRAFDALLIILVLVFIIERVSHYLRSRLKLQVGLK
jgi:phosphonate transport system permease protein